MDCTCKEQDQKCNTGANTYTFDGATTLKLVILEHLSKLKPYMNETHHKQYLIYLKVSLMSLIPTAIQSDIVNPVDMLAMCVSTARVDQPLH